MAVIMNRAAKTARGQPRRLGYKNQPGRASFAQGERGELRVNSGQCYCARRSQNRACRAQKNPTTEAASLRLTFPTAGLTQAGKRSVAVPRNKTLSGRIRPGSTNLPVTDPKRPAPSGRTQAIENLNLPNLRVKHNAQGFWELAPPEARIPRNFRVRGRTANFGTTPTRGRPIRTFKARRAGGSRRLLPASRMARPCATFTKSPFLPSSLPPP